MTTSYEENTDLEVDSTLIEEEYIVESWEDSSFSTTASQKKAICSKSGSVTQGNNKTYTASVGSGAKFLEVDLNWGNKNNELMISYYPSGKSSKSCSDSSDNKIDGRIHVVIKPSNGSNIQQGSWGFEVYGKKVSGTEDYTFAVYQHN